MRPLAAARLTCSIARTRDALAESCKAVDGVISWKPRLLCVADTLADFLKAPADPDRARALDAGTDRRRLHRPGGDGGARGRSGPAGPGLYHHRGRTTGLR